MDLGACSWWCVARAARASWRRSLQPASTSSGSTARAGSTRTGNRDVERAGLDHTTFGWVLVKQRRRGRLLTVGRLLRRRDVPPLLLFSVGRPIGHRL